MENEEEKNIEKKNRQLSNPNLLAGGPGRPAGVPNKATLQAREAIALFVNNNAHRLQEWLELIASGGKYIDPFGKEIFMPPNPTKAFELFMSVIEYHIPKLQRSEVSGVPDGAPVIVRVLDDIK